MADAVVWPANIAFMEARSDVIVASCAFASLASTSLLEPASLAALRCSCFACTGHWEIPWLLDEQAAQTPASCRAEVLPAPTCSYLQLDPYRQEPRFVQLLHSGLLVGGGGDGDAERVLAE